ncbi:uncharacterized protein PHACADRAFT_206916 [Phanerochaete carnosa HHB-10118-sp]|uniref:Uncharacterized protein n=1 Tax=Phanerochaete carnosa (strain HHB-10118-sp) TaxID=650164 RepID=K5WFJ3_PHACS|nr:uncharacterized protein PHACADRAFT_206916 [Phanerochaete carnosa HHB-10118-sp]EKM58075.1 hypothetical protein PHACADRAFT_206916 [Phanerochaete carnosa HHB-10118-sp]
MSGVLSLNEIVERIQREDTRAATLPPARPPPDVDDSIPAWDFDESSHEVETGLQAEPALKGGVAPLTAPPSPATTFFTLDLEDESPLLSPTLMHNILEAEMISSGASTAPSLDGDEPAGEGSGDGALPANITDHPAHGGVELQASSASDQTLVALCLALLDYIARLDATNVRSAAGDQASAPQQLCDCRCREHEASAHQQTDDSQPQAHEAVMQEVYGSQRQVPQPEPEMQNTRDPRLQVYEVPAVQEARASQPATQRDFVRILQPTVQVTRPSGSMDVYDLYEV